MDHETWIPLVWSREIASGICGMIVLSALFNLYAIWSIYNRRGLRNSSTAIIVANLACVDILVSVKDLPTFFNVSVTGHWVFVESWCATYGLTNVIFIIVSVSTLVTITTERFSKLREMATSSESTYSNQNPLVLGYVIAHTTLSYSLSLLWSKYVFVTRKSFCRVEWPPRNGFSATFLSSVIFIVPVSFLIYNLLYRNFVDEERTNKKQQQKLNPLPTTTVAHYEEKAQSQLHVAVAIFLVSWTPYVVESLVSSYVVVSPLTGIFTACVPLLSTSFLPLLYVMYLRHEQKPMLPTSLTVVAQ